MTDHEPSATGWQEWGVRLLPVLTFLVGLGLGTVLMLAAGDDASPSPDADPTPGPTVSEAPDGDTVVVVPEACEGAAANISEATSLLDQAVGSVRDFDPQELVDLLTRLEDLDRETRTLAQQCSAVSVDSSGTVEPTESPSATD